MQQQLAAFDLKMVIDPMAGTGLTLGCILDGLSLGR